ncbi:MAG TPA: polysaccharide deacetylase family protein [Gammaproteobacteria bacterium]
MRQLLNMLSPAGKRARLMIFTYHRIVEQPDPLMPGTPTLERFKRQLGWIKRYCTPIALSEAVARLVKGDLPPRAVAVTFDDGYENNLTLAAPALREHGIPATIFVAVDAVERGIMWNDILAEAVRAASESIDARAAGLGVLRVDDGNKAQVLADLFAAVKYRPVKERLEICEAIYASVSTAPIARQMLRPAQLAELPAFGFEIGAHTVNHPILRILSESEAQQEIDDSRAWIEATTGTRPTLFAYPNGKRGDDYDARHADMVRALGFDAAVSTNWGCASRSTPLFELPRFKPWEDTDFGFVTRLCKVAAQSYVQ